MDTPVLLTEEQAAERLCAKPDTLRKWRIRDRGPTFHKLSGKIRYSDADIEKFIKQSRVVPGKKKARRRKRGVK